MVELLEGPLAARGRSGHEEKVKSARVFSLQRIIDVVHPKTKSRLVLIVRVDWVH